MTETVRRGWRLLVVALAVACLLVIVWGRSRPNINLLKTAAALEARQPSEEPRRALRETSVKDAYLRVVVRARDSQGSGSAEREIRTLEAASRRFPDSAAILNDLAVAYFARARQGETLSLFQALSTVEAALAKDGTLDEALYNRALFLESLSLDALAEDAWHQYLAMTDERVWATEAKLHLKALDQDSRADRWSRGWRSLKALREDAVKVGAIVESSREAAREYAMTELLGEWGASFLEGHHGEADVSLQTALAIGQALDRAAGDATVSDTVRLIEKTSRQNPGALAGLAQGHQAYQKGHALLNQSETSRALVQFEQAIDLFAPGEQIFEQWSRTALAEIETSEARYREAEEGLRSVKEEMFEEPYPSLAAHVHRTLGVVQFRQGRLDDAWLSYHKASAFLERAGDLESRGSLSDLLAEASEALGLDEQAWRYRCLALYQLRDSFGPTDALSQLLHETGERAMAPRVRQAGGRLGLLLQEEALRVSERIGRSPVPSGSLLKRDTSVLDLVQAHLTLARSQAAASMDAAAEANLLQAIHVFEGRRNLLSQGLWKLSYSEKAQELFDEMILFQVDRRGDPRRGLAFSERARILLGQGLPVEDVPGVSASELRRVPSEVVIIEYALVKDCLLIWLIEADRIELVRRNVKTRELRSLVQSFLRSLQKGGGSTDAQDASARLHQILIPEELGPAREVYMIPDKFLNGLPFAALRNPADGRLLIEEHSLGVCTSVHQCLRSMTRSSRRLGPTKAALFIGDPAFDRQRFPMIHALPGPLREIASVRPLYERGQVLLGREATKERFLSLMDDYEVVHYAGHAMKNARNPEFSFLLLAPDRADAGMLYAREISGHRFKNLKLVVLSACDTISAVDSRLAGVSGLAKPFLDGGVEAVVGALWKVEDRGAEELLPIFHQRFFDTGNAAVALRDAQLALLRGSDPQLRRPGVWAAFQLIGASAGHPLTKPYSAATSIF